MTDCTGADVRGEPPFLTFYKAHNLYNGQVVNMSWAGIVTEGYLVDMNLKEYNQNGVEGFMFTFDYLARLKNLFVAPEEAGQAAAAGLADSLSGFSSSSTQGTTPINSGRPSPVKGTTV